MPVNVSVFKSEHIHVSDDKLYLNNDVVQSLG